jgi:hypothetical protein
MIGINFGLQYKAQSAWLGHISRLLFLSGQVTEFTGSPVLSIKRSFIDHWIAGVKYHLGIVVLAEVSKDVERLSQVPFSRQSEVRRQHGRFQTDVNAPKFHNPT